MNNPIIEDGPYEGKAELNYQREKRANKWHTFQNFIAMLELEEMKENRRCILSIEKNLFRKEATK